MNPDIGIARLKKAQVKKPALVQQKK